jgi:hypothetical protein
LGEFIVIALGGVFLFLLIGLAVLEMLGNLIDKARGVSFE